MTRLTQMPQPVIARVQGIATAAGCQLVSMCDLAVASESASFAMPGVNIGIFCSTPAGRVARKRGRKRAMGTPLPRQPAVAETALGQELAARALGAGHRAASPRGH